MTNYFSRRPSHASAIPARRAAQQQQQLVEAPLLAAKAGAALPPAAAAVAASTQRHRTAEVPPIISPVFSPNLHSLERLRGGHLHPVKKHDAVPAVRVYRPGKKAAAPQDAAPAAARPAAEVPKPAAAAAATARPPPPVVATAPRRRDKQRGAIGAAAAAPLSIRIRRRLDRFIDGDMAHLRERVMDLLGDNFVATIPARIAAIPRAINTSESLRALGQAALIAKGVVNKLASDAGVLNAPRRRFIGTERGDLADSRSRGVAAAPRQQREPARVGARQGRAEGVAFALSPALQLRRLAVRLARRLRHSGALSNLILPNLPNVSAAVRAIRRGRAAARVLRSAPAAIAAALLVPAMRAAYVAGTNVNVGRAARGFAHSQLDAPLFSLAPSLGGLYRRAARAAMAQLPVNNNTWYQMLARPVWAMSPRAADMVWSAAVACMAVACYRLLTAPAAFGARVRALFAFGLQLAFCASCGLATIALRSPVAGLVHHVLFAGAVARAFTTARRVDKIAAAALAPVVGLILYECAVQAFVVAMN
jgi:tryptophan-rich sensory protein